MILVAIAGCTAIYAGGAMLAGRYLVDRAIDRYHQRTPERRIAVERVRVNPFTLTVELTGASLLEPRRQTAFAAPRLMLRFSLRTLIEARPVLGTLAIEQPRLTIEWPDREGWPSGSTLAAWIAAAYADLEPLKIGRLELGDGELLLIGPTAEPRAAFRDVAVTVDDWDARAEHAAGYSVDVGVDVGADIGVDAGDAIGTGLRLAGSIEPRSMRAQGRVTVSALDLDGVARWLGARTLVAGGVFDGSGNYRVSVPTAGPVLELTDARGELRGVRLNIGTDLTLQTPRAETDFSALLESAGRTLTAAAELRLPNATLRHTGHDELQFADVAARLNTSPADPSAGTGSARPSVELAVRGQLQAAGDASLTARLDAEAGYRPGSVALRAADLPAALLSAYAAGTLGRELGTGRIGLALDYRLDGNRGRPDSGGPERQRLDGVLGIAATGLTLGAGDSDLPLALALALLEDERGQVDLSVPVSADLGAAQSAPAAIADALRAEIEALADAPFAALERLVDRAGPLGSVHFQAGSATPTAGAAAGLDALADALQQRPALALLVPGRFDPELDRNALATQQIELHVSLATAESAFRERPAPIDFASPRVWDVIEEFATERLAAGTLASIAARFDVEVRGADRPAARAPYYRALFDALVANERIADSTLERLGRFRAQSIAGTLATLGVNSERVETGAAEPVPAAERQWLTVPVTLQLAAIEAVDD